MKTTTAPIEHDRPDFLVIEGKIMDQLVDIHNSFLMMDQTHPADITEWVTAIHQLQSIISMRVLRRLYPNYYTSIKL